LTLARNIFFGLWGILFNSIPQRCKPDALSELDMNGC